MFILGTDCLKFDFTMCVYVCVSVVDSVLCAVCCVLCYQCVVYCFVDSFYCTFSFQNGFAFVRPPGHHALPNQAQ